MTGTVKYAQANPGTSFSQNKKTVVQGVWGRGIGVWGVGVYYIHIYIQKGTQI